MLAPILALAMMQQQPLPSQELRRGSDLVTACKSFVRVIEDQTQSKTVTDLTNANYCMGYLDGLVAYMDKDASHVCLPMHTSSTLARVYIDFMEKHPKLFDEDQKLGAYLALLDAYPCPVKKD